VNQYVPVATKLDFADQFAGSVKKSIVFSADLLSAPRRVALLVINSTIKSGIKSDIFVIYVE
jgi:hypothetical protein